MKHKNFCSQLSVTVYMWIFNLIDIDLANTNMLSLLISLSFPAKANKLLTRLWIIQRKGGSIYIMC